MKILVLIGSFRKHGNTDQVTGMIKVELETLARGQNVPLEIETVYLGHKNLGFCRGCRVCFDRGEDKCPLKDDLLEIKARVKAADGILLASPIYVDDVSAITKNWIDRMAHVCHRPEFAGKSAFLVVTVGASAFGHSLRTMSAALSTWGFHIAGQSGYKTGALMDPAEAKARFQEKAALDARKFFHDLTTRKFRNPSFLSLMTFKIQQLAWQGAADGSFDYHYWEKQGWLQAQQEYYIPHEANRIKVALARIAGRAIAPFVL